MENDNTDAAGQKGLNTVVFQIHQPETCDKEDEKFTQQKKKNSLFPPPEMRFRTVSQALGYEKKKMKKKKTAYGSLTGQHESRKKNGV